LLIPARRGGAQPPPAPDGEKRGRTVGLALGAKAG